jgi:single-stranded-DNA-specific exonuclease
MDKLWEILNPDPACVHRIMKALDLHPTVATVLVNRNIDNEQLARRFLSPQLTHLRSPFSISDMTNAVQRVYDALYRKEKIMIFGDYDVDGITSSACIYQFLKLIGARVSCHIPHRIKEGYGLQEHHITGIIVPEKIKLVITADCGSGSHSAVEKAKSLGIDVIITDHHQIASPIPGAVAIINPNRKECTSGLGHLAGVGVSFFLIIALRTFLRDKGFWKDKTEPNLKQFFDLVILGTVADMAPMIHENRIFYKAGLPIIRSGRRRGIRALAESSGTPIHSVDTDEIAFRLSPRLNAAGRIGHAKIAFELLLEKERESAGEKADLLCRLNSTRQELEKKLIEEIDQRIRTSPEMLRNRSLVLWGEGWHEGILGIAASKLTEKYFRPTILISLSDGIGKGSARSIPGIDICRSLQLCIKDLEGYGGHPMAAGLRVKYNRIESFAKSFENAITGFTRPEHFIPKLTIDCRLPLDALSSELIDGLEEIKPYGPGNPAPLFMAEDVFVVRSRIVGKKHRRMILSERTKKGMQGIEAIQFNIMTDAPVKDRFSRIAYRPCWNCWDGRKNPQIIIEEAE